MKKTITLLAALLATGLSWGEEPTTGTAPVNTYTITQVFDLGETGKTTTGAINITEDSFTSKKAAGKMADMPGSYNVSYSAPVLLTTQDGENGKWKTNFEGALPMEGAASTMSDALVIRTNDTTTPFLTYTITFSGLSAGTYSLSLFGAYHGDVTNNGANKDKNAGNVYFDLEEAVSANTEAAQYSAQVYNGTGWESATFLDTITPGANAYADMKHISSSNHADKGYAINVSNIVVEDGGSFTLKMVAHADPYENFPLNAMKLTAVVPEPATATLSLLALAGLAARRRRK